MSQETLRYALVMLAAGIGIPVLAALNSALGVRLASPTAATVCLFAVALMAAIFSLAFTGTQGLSKITTAPLHLFGGGLLVAFYVLSITYIAPKFGVGNAVFLVLLGQLVSAAAIDHFGLFGAKISPISPSRMSGIALMAVGVFLTQRV